MPGIVTVEAGVIVRSPELLLPVQNVPARLAVCKIKGLLPGPPVVAFHLTRTSRTVIESCGLMIVRLIVGLPPGIYIELAQMLSQPGIGVDVEVGVNVMVGVKVVVGIRVSVKVGVIVGVSVAVVLGSGVNVIKSPPGFVAVGVGVSDGMVDVGMGVYVLDGVPAIAVCVLDIAVNVPDAPPPPPPPANGSVPSSKNPRIVRALVEVNLRDGRGSNLTIGA